MEPWDDDGGREERAGAQSTFTDCAECEERHDADWDCRTYVPICEDCGDQGDRRFRQRAPAVRMRDEITLTQMGVLSRHPHTRDRQP